MTPPRRTVGTNSAGRLPAAMLRALAAELSDPGRFSRAKAYARDGAVVDIDIEPGQARGQVQGSRDEPYAVTIHAEPARDGEGLLGLIPERDELFTECSCPDADTFGTCKHALAVLLVLADEVSIDTAVLERWRSAGADGTRPRRNPEPAAADETQDHLPSAATRFAGSRQQVHVGILRLTHEVHPVDLVPEVLGEAIEAVEVDADALAGRRLGAGPNRRLRGWHGLRGGRRLGGQGDHAETERQQRECQSKGHRNLVRDRT